MKKVAIGSKYPETVMKLRNKIRANLVEVIIQEADRKYACYYCCTTIKGDVCKVIDQGKHYFLDTRCYESNASIH